MEIPTLNKKNRFVKIIKDRTNIDLSTKQDVNRIFYCFDKYIPLVATLILCISFIFMAVTDNKSLTSPNFIYIALITLPIMIAYILWMPVVNKFSIPYFWKVFWTIIVLVISFVLILLVYFGYSYLSQSDITIIGYIRIILYVIFTILLIKILYDLIFTHIDETKGLLGFFLRLLVIIPQALVAIFNYLFKNITIKQILLLLLAFILTFIIIIYLFYSKIANYVAGTSTTSKTSFTNSALVLKGPIFIYGNNASSLEIPPTLPNYSFSFWLYLNNIPTSNIEVSIFEYGNKTPKLSVLNDNIYNMLFYPSNREKSVPFNLDTQKWNYIVFQYNGKTMDLFVNTKLITSINITNDNMPIYSLTDNIIIGSNNEYARGLGSITNVIYYNKPLTAQEMNTAYELLKTQDVPSNF